MSSSLHNQAQHVFDRAYKKAKLQGFSQIDRLLFAGIVKKCVTTGEDENTVSQRVMATMLRSLLKESKTGALNPPRCRPKPTHYRNK